MVVFISIWKKKYACVQCSSNRKSDEKRRKRRGRGKKHYAHTLQVTLRAVFAVTKDEQRQNVLGKRFVLIFNTYLCL